MEIFKTPFKKIFGIKKQQNGQSVIDRLVAQEKTTEQQQETIESFLDYLYQKGKDKPNKPLAIHKNTIVQGFYLNYLFKKFGSECFLPNNSDNRPFGIYLVIPVLNTPDQILDQNQYQDNSDAMFHLNPSEIKYEAGFFIKNFKKCIDNKTKFIIIPLSLDIIFMNSRNEDEDDEYKHSRHSNVIICRRDEKNKKKYIFEHFEPHGSYISYGQAYEHLISKTIQEYFLEGLKTKYGIEYEFKPSSNVCPLLGNNKRSWGLQRYENRFQNVFGSGGYCVMWTTFFTEMCLRNPNLSAQQVLQRIKKYINNEEDKIQFIFKGFAEKIADKLNKYYSEIINKYIENDVVENDNDDDDNDADEVVENKNEDIEITRDVTNKVWRNQKLKTFVNKVFIAENSGFVNNADEVEKELLNTLKSNLSKINKRKILGGGGGTKKKKRMRQKGKSRKSRK